MKLATSITLSIASLALIAAIGACSKEEKTEPAAAPVTPAAVDENSAAAAATAELANKMAANAVRSAEEATAAAAVAVDQAEAAGDMAEAAGDMARAQGDLAEAAGDLAQAAGDTASAIPPGFGAEVSVAMNAIIVAAQTTKGDCTKVAAVMGPVIAKHAATFQMMGKTRSSAEATAWMSANMALIEKFQTAFMPLAMCASKDPKVAELLNQMK
ncbi:MAG TPA: hypothetical protein VML75_19415 [Kofleriaceae bacterium]|nr:hypothetical protein [Kofleriaceae bacterium]